MNNNLLQLKIKQRLNKLDSMDYDNIECWQIAEAFNKAQLEWIRKQVHGTNVYREGDEGSKIRIDDLQILSSERELTHTALDLYNETEPIPGDYLYFKRLNVKATKDCCNDPRRIVVYLAEAADTDILLFDKFKEPSFEWGETFATMGANRFRIYHNNDFVITKPVLSYYRKPKSVSFLGCKDPSTGLTTVNQECEFKDDVVELILDEATAILAGDLEIFHQLQRNKQNAESNN